MKKTVFATLLIVTFLTAPVALAANPHFIRASASLDHSGNLVVSWKEAGLGDNQMIHYLASADSSGFYACINKSCTGR